MGTLRKATLVASALIAAIASAQTPTDLKAKAEFASRPFLPIIEKNATAYGVDTALVQAIISVESAGDPNAQSPAGAMGLMQLMPATCLDYGVAAPFDPESNVRGGCALLARHLGRYKGDLKKVLAAYNAGPGHADDGSWVNIPETKRYVPLVLATYAALQPNGDGFSKSIPTLAYIPPPGGLNAMDRMFAAIKFTAPDPVSLAQNGALEDTADTLIVELANGKLKDPQARATNLLVKAGHRPKTLCAYAFTTKDEESFASAWVKQPPTKGRLFGLAHGSKKGTHLWVILSGEF